MTYARVEQEDLASVLAAGALGTFLYIPSMLLFTLSIWCMVGWFVTPHWGFSLGFAQCMGLTVLKSALWSSYGLARDPDLEHQKHKETLAWYTFRMFIHDILSTLIYFGIAAVLHYVFGV